MEMHKFVPHQLNAIIMRGLFYSGLLSLVILLLTACENKPVKVKIYGSLKEVMHENDLSSKISLNKIKDKRNLYALGAVENLQGEIMIYNGSPFISYVKAKNSGTTYKIDTSFNHNATLLASAVVKSWKEVPVPDTIKSIKDIESFLMIAGKKHGIDFSKPFPFRLEGIAEFAEWHIIKWDTTETQHSHKKHQKNSLKGYIHHSGVDILGFYAPEPGIITHHNRKTHMHIKTIDDHQAGHLDQLKADRELKLYLPKQKISY